VKHPESPSPSGTCFTGAADEAFASEGIAAVSLSDIAVKAGLTPADVAVEFLSKDGTEPHDPIFD